MNRINTPLCLFLALCTSVLIFGCNFNDKKDAEEADKNEMAGEATVKSASPERGKKNPGITDVVTTSMEFKTLDEVSSGWNTFRYKNQSNETHFLLVEKYPEGKGIENARKELAPPFQEGMNFLVEGKNEEAMKAFEKIPAWFSEVEMYGGTGLISPKSTAQSTIFMEPGTYILECYVKMPNGVFHSMEGMLKEIRVTKDSTDMPEPTADYRISISSEKGIIVPSNIKAGEHTFAVHFESQKKHENFNWHDVHLVWVDEGADIEKLNEWMNWANPTGLQTPSPEGFKFLGGSQEMAAGKTGYFKVNLRPGNYALVSEVPDPKSKNMLKTFKVQ
ncbi:hypothetical protein [Christiangramia salexigens]|uniref:Uncharacterized protein n=1 Tax=Christiangramia salexigens TaxID=1913577 RepID=A0A1L3J7C5_9FLAO|nr:hypothetical protein [Christiangramia salexigens]APG61037.1 hypothetical protein LPB144_11745 [Christiangramia salexigens]